MTASLTFVAPGAATTGVIDVREQEKAAFDAFVRARLPELLRFGRALTGSPEAAAAASDTEPMLCAAEPIAPSTSVVTDSIRLSVSSTAPRADSVTPTDSSR